MSRHTIQERGYPRDQDVFRSAKVVVNNLNRSAHAD